MEAVNDLDRLTYHFVPYRAVLDGVTAELFVAR